jgi:hypothetical protein
VVALDFELLTERSTKNSGLKEIGPDRVHLLIKNPFDLRSKKNPRATTGRPYERDGSLKDAKTQNNAYPFTHLPPNRVIRLIRPARAGFVFFFYKKSI